ncbi:Gfo/Idh/MocA family oxidoreductase [Enterococcus gallinarum]|jgi:predicted dehydrogenase|uniref:Gfo/Idh/MocA family protein n=1 Tax=Enterococcus TaxID=1350 RepID=UPI001D129A5E|nr:MULTISPECIES: Gfo/Idh/MocA family oxidoreductase [Enterococcus]MCC2752573.1 Gfo/Idh/MocA family oxidoreductase [Enterococcus gallinarum]MCD5184828.1 Gfo/Idh/MocA family oxidoreductase [Enterococcus gallinarum]MEB6064735.1 Gfo/Idh/MocA family oxidoreductase [Enterococcus gallinarum]
MNKLRFGFIGCGGIANSKHFPALAKLADKVEMVAFCDIIEERAIKAAEEYGISDAFVTTDYIELTQREDIDVIHVLTPNISHSFITVAALEAGKHVMCEKPMAINYEEAKKMLDAAERTGKKLTIGYQNRFRADSLATFDACSKGELGDIYFAKAHAIRRKGVPTWGVFPDKEKQGGGPLIDIGTHALDLTLWFMDNYKPKLVLGSTYQKLKDNPMGNMFGSWDPETFETEDSAFGLIKMENGATIFLEAAWALNMVNPKEAQVTLCGTEAGAEMFGKAFLDQGYVVFNRAAHNQLEQTEPSDAGGVFGFEGATLEQKDAEALQWVDAIINDTEPLVKPEQAIVVTQILEAIYKSAETGLPVEL